MSRGSFGRTVARAAASGGSSAYRTRRPRAFYALMLGIVILGIGLISYSRHEVLNPPKKATVGPTAGSNWYAAYAIDICGVVQPNLATNANTAGIGIRTFGDGLIDIDPAAANTAAANFEGAKATLALFASSYPKFTLTSTSLQLPTTGATLYKNGAACKASKSGEAAGPGQVTIKVWASRTAKTGKTYTDPALVHLTNGQLITIGFVPKGATLAKPASVSTLATRLGSTSSKKS